MGVKERREREEHLRLEAILAAAEMVFSRSGYHEARMDDIAAEAELSKGALYYYFKSKDEIFARLLKRDSERMLAEVRSRIPENLDFVGALERLMSFLKEYADVHRGFMTMILSSMGGFVRFGDPQIVLRARQGMETFGMFIRDILETKIRREDLPFHADDFQFFFKAFHLGIGMAIHDGRRNEADAAIRFFLDLTGLAVKKRAEEFPAASMTAGKSGEAAKRKKPPRSSSNCPK